MQSVTLKGIHGNWNASPSPHIRDNVTTRGLMRDVCIALLPALACGVYFYGWQSLRVIIACAISAVTSEFAYQKLAKKPVRVNDLSALVTGLLLACNLPPTAPWWLCVIGGVIAIVLIKQIFGGVGQNFFNPALGARAILMISWATQMTAVMAAQPGVMTGVDTVSIATPLAMRYVSEPTPYTIGQLFLGNIPGMLGETSKLALLIGLAYLLARRVITWHIPVTFIGTALILFTIKHGTIFDGSISGVVFSSQQALYQILSGGLFLGAIFMATDYVTSPIHPLGKVVMGVGCGLILFVIREFNPAYPEGCSFAILLMNLLTPLVNRVFKPKMFGERPAPKAVKKTGEVKSVA
ncbi:MAG: RnfABCDGE type electron transport complex subunit D [Oscillospiraceae bacterium]|jgi:electron transport complex protein RnfD|nr:RnfABCDGE type electron transport complex subunit D [Oscillospiraceae bacterium]